MLVHFVSDYFHYDGKFWTTLKLLMFYPGKLSTMYLQGKRASYLKPVQLYIFISAVFFIVFYKIVHLKVVKDGDRINATFTTGRVETGTLSDTAFSKQLAAMRAAREKFKNNRRKIDSALNALPGLSARRFLVLTVKKFINYGQKKNLHTGGDIVESILATLFHSIPKLFFVLMPVLALLLKLFFRRKEYVYVDHAVMSLHLHSFLFVSFMIGYLISFASWDHGILDWIFFAVVPLIYFFSAFHHFYKTRWFTTILKGIFIIPLYLFIILVSSIINLILLIWLG